MTHKHHDGFSLFELVLCLTIVAILAAIAVPSMVTHSRRTYYSDIIIASAAAKAGVTECYQETKMLLGCSSGKHHVPKDIHKPTGIIADLTTVDGIIAITPMPQRGVSTTDDYILTPTIVGQGLHWQASGDSVKKNYAN
jgi:prepilin-type N-terminal cleavage/methylation domain-containing protein